MNALLGLVKSSFIDYPGEIAATMFTAGCNLRCPYCHNPELVDSQPPVDFLPLSEIVRFLERRRDHIGAVCITGGEPLLQPWLPELISTVRDLGLKVKLDTNGLLPDRLPGLKLDYLAVDLKLSPAHYQLLGRAAGAQGKLGCTMEWARRSVPFVEYRTTVVPGLVESSDIEAIVSLLRPGERLTLAAFRPGRTLDPTYRSIPAPEPAMMEAYRQLARAAGLLCEVRDHRNTTRGSV